MTEEQLKQACRDHFQSGAMYIHVDGGIYMALNLGKSSVDQSEHVVYEHLFPFKHEVWIRPLLEWTPERFKPVSDDDGLTIIMSSDRAVMQAEIAERKKERRAREHQSK